MTDKLLLIGHTRILLLAVTFVIAGVEPWIGVPAGLFFCLMMAVGG